MGDGADDAILRGIDEMLDPTFDPEGEEGPFPPPTKTCRLCKKTGLHWEMRASGKWRLCDARGIHVCPVHPIKDPPPKPSMVEPFSPYPATPDPIWLPPPANFKIR